MNRMLHCFREQPGLTLLRYRPRGSRNHHFSVRDEASGASGSGGDVDELLAQKKALFEWIERRVFRDSGSPTSSGWAAHGSADAARRAAALELVERDALLCSWLLKKSPRLLGEVAFPTFARSFSLLQFGSGPDFVVLGVVVESGGKRMLLSTAASTLAHASLKLQIDAERALSLLEAGGPRSEPLAAHHRAFCSLPTASLEWLTSGGDGISYRELAFTFETFEAPLWDGSVAYVARAECAALQSLYFGRARLRAVNRARLRQLGGKKRLNRERHPLL